MSAWCLLRPSAAFQCLAPRLLCPVTLHGGASSRALSVARDSVSMRLARRIAAAGVCSRREAEQLIAEGHVTVNGRVVDTPAVNVTLGDAVVVQGAALPVGVLPKQQMWCCHKLEGELVSRRDPKGRPTLFDRLAKMGVPGSSGLIAVGRLGYNVEGLLLLTNSGSLSRALELAHLSQVYDVRVEGKVTGNVLESLRRGVVHDGVKYPKVDARLTGKAGANSSWLELTFVSEKVYGLGQLLSVFSLTVERVIRRSVGPYKLGSLPRGSVLQVPVHHSVHELLLAAEHSKPRVQSVDVPRRRIVEATIVEPTENNRL